MLRLRKAAKVAARKKPFNEWAFRHLRTFVLHHFFAPSLGRVPLPTDDQLLRPKQSCPKLAAAGGWQTLLLRSRRSLS